MRWLPPLLMLLASQGCAFPPSRGPGMAPHPAPQGGPTPAPSEAASAAPPEAAPAPEAPAPPAPEPTADAGDMDGEDGEDGDEPDEAPSASRTAPKIDLTDEQISEKARKDLASLGPISAGSPGAGWLVNGVQMPRDPRWELIGAPNTWGTQETIDFLTRSIGDVNKRFADTPPLAIGHISGHNGGHLSPHKSHQAGRDVDLGFYYSTRDARWFTRGTARNLDLPRTWALLKSMINDTDVEMIFIDTSIQHLLAHHAVSAGEDAAYLDRVFQVRGKSNAPVIRHVKGHATHIHVRFHSPVAQEMFRRAQRFLKRPAVAVASKGHPGAPAPGDPTQYVMHRARNGDVLVNLAKQYNTTPEAIARANGLQGTALKVGQTYKIPVPAKPGASHAPPKGAPAHGHSPSRSRG